MNNSYEVKTDTQKSTGRHVLVIGGSLAGLFAARVLADFFEKITILDRDVFPVRPDHRRGVPQSYHAHALLPTAFPILERLFPGIMNDLCKDGAVYHTSVKRKGNQQYRQYGIIAVTI
jgi:2-polyprenyl-6-methoxyphenol hydroxylase-like FAD-dependent oxidoreductase